MNYTFSDKIASLKPSAIREILKMATLPGIISFSAGNPSPLAFPVEQMNTLSNEIFADMAIPALQYGISEGYQPLRESVSALIKRKFDIGRDFDDLIIVSGGQQGIDLACKSLCNEGDTIICENPSFIGALNAFRSYNVKLVGIPAHDDGMDIELLEQALKTHKDVKMIYTIPTFQNPMGVTMPLDKRCEMYALAKKYNVIILEDNPYGDLRYEGEDIPTLKSMDTEGIVIYAGSFSKIFAPALRIGYVSAPKPIIQKMVVAKQVSDVHTNLFFQIMIDKYLKQYDLDAHIANIRSLYGKKCKLMLDACDTHLGGGFKLTRPQGGLFLWAESLDGTDGVKIASEAIKKNIAIVPGVALCVDDSVVCPAFRLNFSQPTENEIVTGIEILGNVIKSM